MSNKTKEELTAYKEKFLVIVQDTFAAFMIGMIELEEFLNMVVVMSSMLHAIFHENGERTWKCEAKSHDTNFEKIDDLYEGIILDRTEGNDIISWVEDPAKKEQLKRDYMRKVMQYMDSQKDAEPVSGHLR